MLSDYKQCKHEVALRNTTTNSRSSVVRNVTPVDRTQVKTSKQNTADQ